MRLRRLDSELVRRGIARSRGRAQELIESGRVRLDGEVVLKPARQMNPAQAIVVAQGDDEDYVSRGAHKLAGALDALGDAAPVIAGFAVMALAGAWGWGWPFLAAGALWGAGAAWAGIAVGGRLLDSRGVRILTTIRSWPGHEEAR